MTLHPDSVKCYVCKDSILIEDVKYHTARGEGNIKVFCGPECSLKYYGEKKCQLNTEKQVNK
jgi:hypothetical protein